MKLATWNVNSIRIRQSQVWQWLHDNPVDILCLQETKVIDKDFPTSSFSGELGYYVYVYGQKAYNGVAIFSRQLMTDISVGFMPVIGEDLGANFDEQKRVISGVIDDVRIVNIYVPNGSDIGSEKYDYKLRWLKMLREYLQLLLAKTPSEICICGDFNIALEDRDIYDAKGKENHIMSSPSERQALKAILDLGFADAFRKFTSEGGYFSWWDYRAAGFPRNRGWRIDHCYLTPKLYDRAISCTIDIDPRKQNQPSDHAPVIVQF